MIPCQKFFGEPVLFTKFVLSGRFYYRSKKDVIRLSMTTDTDVNCLNIITIRLSIVFGDCMQSAKVKSNVRPYNSTLKELSAQFEATFIDNHDSFILASGELPFEYFQADKVNLKFPGTRLLVQNINKSCVILPPRQTPRDQSKTPQFPHRSTRKTNRNNTSRSFSH